MTLTLRKGDPVWVRKPAGGRVAGVVEETSVGSLLGLLRVRTLDDGIRYPHITEIEAREARP
jgi:hypothetical protein